MTTNETGLAAVEPYVLRWVLMTLLFVLGVMNLLWIAGLALFVLAENVAPRGERISRVTGIFLVG